MSSWADVRAVATALPGAQEQDRDGLAWRVGERLFAWERPLRRADLEALGPAAPDGPVLAARVPDLGVRAALIEGEPAVYFTTPHFAGYPAVLVRLGRIGPVELRELLVEAWLSRAPARLARAYLDQNARPGDKR